MIRLYEAPRKFDDIFLKREFVYEEKAFTFDTEEEFYLFIKHYGLKKPYSGFDHVTNCVVENEEGKMHVRRICMVNLVRLIAEKEIR